MIVAIVLGLVISSILLAIMTIDSNPKTSLSFLGLFVFFGVWTVAGKLTLSEYIIEEGRVFEVHEVYYNQLDKSQGVVQYIMDGNTKINVTDTFGAYIPSKYVQRTKIEEWGCGLKFEEKIFYKAVDKVENVK